MVTGDRDLDTVECLIGSEITSNPIQHVRIKPPERDVKDGETRAHIVSTDWHQDRAVTLETADNGHSLVGNHGCDCRKWVFAGETREDARDDTTLFDDPSRHCREIFAKT